MVIKMATTIPSTNIQLFGNLNLSPNYENSLYFETTQAKDSYFDSIPKKAVFSSCSYQRENRNYIRVQSNIGAIYNAQYMRFQNPDFENKWWYAFITDVNYVNNVTTEIAYQLDYLMTWMGDFKLNQCYVVRQHVRNDNIGANICDEGLPTGEYVVEKTYSTIKTGKNDMYIVIVYMPDSGQGTYFGGIYSGCALRVCSNPNEANNFINDMIVNNKADSIVNIFMCPKEYFTSDSDVTQHVYAFDKPYDDLNGYVPKNKKMFCYPYKFAEVDNMEGQTQRYLYEYFNTVPWDTSTGVWQLQVVGTVTANCELLLYPVNYKGGTGKTDFSTPPMSSLGMSHFPLSSWGVDAYKAWVAQKNAYFPIESREKIGNGVMANAAGGFVSGGMSQINQGGDFKTAMGVGALVGATEGALSGLVNTANATYNNALYNNNTMPSADISKGEQSTDVLSGSGQKTFAVYEKTLTRNYAIMIDNYFTMYGYAIKQVLTPSMNVREHFTYVQTIGCSVAGSLPAADAKIIESIFDNGCRFWKDYTKIGNYDLDNSRVVG